MAVFNTITIPLDRNILTYFFSRIRISTTHFYNNDPCWEWTGGSLRQGYAFWRPHFGGRRWYIPLHRALYHYFVEVPDNTKVCDHLCRVRHCVNPAHMELVTQRENVLRGEGIAVAKSQQTHCVNGHPLEGDNVITLNQNGNRACRACAARRVKEYWARLYALPIDHPERVKVRERQRQHARRSREKKSNSLRVF